MLGTSTALKKLLLDISVAVGGVAGADDVIDVFAALLFTDVFIDLKSASTSSFCLFSTRR